MNKHYSPVLTNIHMYYILYHPWSMLMFNIINYSQAHIVNHQPTLIFPNLFNLTEMNMFVNHPSWYYVQIYDPYSSIYYNYVWMVWNIFLFSHIFGIIIPIDFHIFQRGGWTTNQYNYGWMVDMVDDIIMNHSNIIIHGWWMLMIHSNITGWWFGCHFLFPTYWYG